MKEVTIDQIVGMVEKAIRECLENNHVGKIREEDKEAIKNVVKETLRNSNLKVIKNKPVEENKDQEELESQN